MKNPVILYWCTGLSHLIYCIWSIRSLYQHGYKTIEVIVTEEWEKQFIQSHLPSVLCEVISKANIGDYLTWTFRPPAFIKYQIKHADRDVIICDADVLWKSDPVPLFQRFEGKPWVHKIISRNPADLNMETIAPSNIGLQTMVNYKKRMGLKVYPNFQINCGLLMLTKEIFPKVIEEWVRKITALPGQEVISTEAILSLVYAEMGLQPISDREDIKHLKTIQHDSVAVPVVSFEISETPEGMKTGYQTARHYFSSDQKVDFYRDVLLMGLDPDHLMQRAKRNLLFNKIKKFPKKILRKLGFPQF